MTINLSNLKPKAGSRKRIVRVGRGNASGHGTFSGRGIKGQRARSGGRKKLARRGLKQMLQQLPKTRGFQSIHENNTVVNIGELQEKFAAQSKVTPETLRRAGLIRKAEFVKVLGTGTLKNALQVHAHAFSATAKTAIEKAGGSATVIPILKQPMPRRQAEKLRKAEIKP
jgi:large subunit ribosomal protein L15